MATPDPYRKERDLGSVIPRDRRPFMAAVVGGIVGALLASTLTLAWIRRTPIQVTADCTDRSATSALPNATAAAASKTVVTCRLDPASGVRVERDPLPELPRYPEAVVRTSLGDVAHSSAVVDLETCASLEDVRAFYRSRTTLLLDGERSGADEHLFTFTKDDPTDPSYTLVFNVSLSRANEGTRIHLTSSMPRIKKGAPPAPAIPPPDGPRHLAPSASRPSITDRF